MLLSALAKLKEFYGKTFCSCKEKITKFTILDLDCIEILNIINKNYIGSEKLFIFVLWKIRTLSLEYEFYTKTINQEIYL